jgi:hypothetical protein
MTVEEFNIIFENIAVKVLGHSKTNPKPKRYIMSSDDEIKDGWRWIRFKILLYGGILPN